MAPVEQRSLRRIGELSRRSGVSVHVLRAWESRYGLLDPVRSEGGYRLYSEQDEWRVRRMRSYLDAGLAAAQAADVVLQEASEADRQGVRTGAPPAEQALALITALEQFDEPSAQAVLDRVLADLTVGTALRDVVLPVLHQIGVKWESGELSIAQEHFASNVLRGRLAGMARGWGGGRGPLALLACPPGELHDIALLAFGIVLNRDGWRISFLGADSPVADIASAAAVLRPSVVILAATSQGAYEVVETEVSKIAAVVPMFIAGAGATEQLARKIGARVMPDDVVSAAQTIVAEFAASSRQTRTRT